MALGEKTQSVNTLEILRGYKDFILNPDSKNLIKELHETIVAEQALTEPEIKKALESRELIKKHEKFTAELEKAKKEFALEKEKYEKGLSEEYIHIDNETASLVNLDKTLKQKEQQYNQQLADLNAKADELNSFAEKLQLLEKDLGKRKTDIRNKEIELSERETVIIEKENTINSFTSLMQKK